MDPFATNYNATACYNDSSCTYPTANASPLCDDLESGSGATYGWVLGQQTYASAAVWGNGATFVVNGHPGNNGPIAGNYSLKFEGGDAPTGWGGYSTEAQRYANTTHVSSSTILMDFSSSPASIEMSFRLGIFSGFGNVGYTSMRVKVGGVVIPDVAGNTSYYNGAAPFTAGAPAETIIYNMSAYSGQSNVSVTFEFAGKYSTNYSSGLYGNIALVDDICFYDLTPCSYYNVSASVDTDASCNGGSDGSATASASFGSGAYSYSWDNGATTATSTGLSAGTYCCVITDDTLGCSDSICVTITEPVAISLSAVTVDPSSGAVNDGSIDLSVSGGTACQTSADVFCGPHQLPYNSTFTRGWYFQAQSSFTVSALMCPDDASPGLATNQTVAIVDYGTTSPVVPFALPSQAAHGNSFAAYDVAGGWISIPGGFQVIAGNYYGLIGAAHAPGSTTLNNSYGAGGLTVVLDGIPTVQGRLGIQGGIGAYAASGNTLPTNTTWGTPAGSIGRIHIRTGVIGANPYNYAWSTGDSTEDLSN